MVDSGQLKLRKAKSWIRELLFYIVARWREGSLMEGTQGRMRSIVGMSPAPLASRSQGGWRTKGWS